MLALIIDTDKLYRPGVIVRVFFCLICASFVPHLTQHVNLSQQYLKNS